MHVYSLPHITTTHAAGLADAPVLLPMKKRPYFISFIGRWTKNAIRMELAHLHSRAGVSCEETSTWERGEEPDYGY